MNFNNKMENKMENKMKIKKSDILKLIEKVKLKENIDDEEDLRDEIDIAIERFYIGNIDDFKEWLNTASKGDILLAVLKLIGEETMYRQREVREVIERWLRILGD